MKPFEERYTEWIDGRLTGAELEAFERELPDHAAAVEDRRHAQKLGDLLRQQVAPTLTQGDFFAHQLLQRIADETAAPVAVAEPERGWSLFSWPNLVWATACCLLLATTFYFVQIAPGRSRNLAALSTEPGKPSLPITASQEVPAAPVKSGLYDASILETTTVEPGVSASVYSQADNITVLWLDGLDYLPASYNLQ